MRFLFINQYYAPDFAATAQQMADLCERLVEAGHEVHVLTSRSLYDGRDMELQAEERLNGVHVHRVNLASGSRRRLRDRLGGYISFYCKALLRVHTLPRADVVVTLTTPPMISLLGTWLRVTRRTRFVYWVMDIYPDIAIKARVLARRSLVRAVWSLLGRFSYMTANRIVVLGTDMKDRLMRKGVGERKIEVIQSWSCGDEVYPVEHSRNPFIRDFLGEARFTVMYSGNMGTCHTFDAVIKAISSLNGNCPYRFAFIGSGRKESQLREGLAAHDDRVVFLPYQDRKELNNSLSAGDVHLITLDPEFDGLLVPSKLYGIMAAGRPVLFVGGPDNEVARILDAAKCGVRVDPDDPEGLLEALREFYEDRDRTRAMGDRGRAYFERWFERKRACDRFIAVLEEEVHGSAIRGMGRLANRTLQKVAPVHSAVPDSDSQHQIAD